MQQGTEQIIKSQQMLKCPYDPNHNVPRQTFFKHLDKCKSPYKDLYVQCPFNPFHYPRKDKQMFRKHCRECPQRLKWAEIEKSKSEQYELLLIQDDPIIEGQPMGMSMANQMQNNLGSSSLSSSWMVEGNMNPQNMSKNLPGDDSNSIYFSQVEKSKLMAQSQVWQVNDPSKNPNNSMFLSQIKGQQNPYGFSQYGGMGQQMFIPPPSMHSGYSGYQQPYPAYPYQYQQPYMQPPVNYSPEKGYGGYDQEEDEEWQENEEVLYQQEEDDGREKTKKEKKSKKEKKDKKEKKEKKSKKSED